MSARTQNGSIKYSKTLFSSVSDDRTEKRVQKTVPKSRTKKQFYRWIEPFFKFQTTPFYLECGKKICLKRMTTSKGHFNRDENRMSFENYKQKMKLQQPTAPMNRRNKSEIFSWLKPFQTKERSRQTPTYSHSINESNRFTFCCNRQTNDIIEIKLLRRSIRLMEHQ